MQSSHKARYLNQWLPPVLYKFKDKYFNVIHYIHDKEWYQTWMNIYFQTEHKSVSNWLHIVVQAIQNLCNSMGRRKVSKYVGNWNLHKSMGNWKLSDSLGNWKISNSTGNWNTKSKIVKKKIGKLRQHWNNDINLSCAAMRIVATQYMILE